MATVRFEGFRPEAIQFIADLAANNDRAWFGPRKADYERFISDGEVASPGLRDPLADVFEAAVPILRFTASVG